MRQRWARQQRWVATAGLLDGSEVTTWSQRGNLALFPNLTVAAGYPRWVIHGNRFSGGGISSSIDLTLVSLLSGPTQSMAAQLSIQYSPNPPFASGDPGQVPPEVTAPVLQTQQDFLAIVRLAVEKVIGKG